MNEIMVRIRFQLPSLPRAEKAVAEALLETPEAIAGLTLAKLASETGSSDASVIRFCKRLGYNGYTEFKTAFLSALGEDPSLNRDVIDTLDAGDNMGAILKKVFQSNMQTLSETLSLAGSNYDDALAAMEKANSIHFFGVGDAYVVCLLAHMKLFRMGISGSAYSDVVLQFNAAANLKPGDVAFAISYEGRSRNVVEAMRIAKEQGATTICITKMNKSPLLKVCDIMLYISTTDLTYGRDKVARRVADQVIIDALITALIVKRGREGYNKAKAVRLAIDRNKI